MGGEDEVRRRELLPSPHVPEDLIQEMPPKNVSFKKPEKTPIIAVAVVTFISATDQSDFTDGKTESVEEVKKNLKAAPGSCRGT